MNLILYLFDSLPIQREISSDFKTQKFNYTPLVEYVLKTKREEKIS